MMRTLGILPLTFFAAVLQAQTLLPKDAKLAGEYIMAAYHMQLLLGSGCRKYASLSGINATRIKNDVLGAFPDKAQSSISAAVNSEEFQRQARLLTYGGINGMVKTQMESGLSQEAACARLAGALEQNFRTLRTRWLELTGA